MKVLILHDRYHDATPGGETHVVRRERALLEAHGVGTQLVEWPPAAAKASPFAKATVLAGAAYSRAARRRVEEALATGRPDLVHVHNVWPRATPAVHYACRRNGLPVVQTLHNYRLFCAADVRLRDSRPCDRCLDAALPWAAVRYRCERHSVVRSALKAAAFALHRQLDTWNRTVHAFITWSAAMRGQFIRAGLDADRVVVMPHAAPDAGIGPEARGYFLYVGRLTPEKGVATLLEAWRQLSDVPLRIAGSGPLEPLVRAAAARTPQVRYLGQLGEDQAREQMRGAIATLVPSLWEEPSPLVIPESYAAATPVIAADTGTRAETVPPGDTGLVYPAGNPAALAAQVRWALAHPDTWRAMGRAARRRYDAEHSGSASIARLMAIYAAAQRRARDALGRPTAC